MATGGGGWWGGGVCDAGSCSKTFTRSHMLVSSQACIDIRQRVLAVLAAATPYMMRSVNPISTYLSGSEDIFKCLRPIYIFSPLFTLCPHTCSPLLLLYHFFFLSHLCLPFLHYFLRLLLIYSFPFSSSSNSSISVLSSLGDSYFVPFSLPLLCSLLLCCFHLFHQFSLLLLFTYFLNFFSPSHLSSFLLFTFALSNNILLHQKGMWGMQGRKKDKEWMKPRNDHMYTVMQR